MILRYITYIHIIDTLSELKKRGVWCLKPRTQPVKITSLVGPKLHPSGTVFFVEQLGKFQARLWWLLDGKMELVATLKFTTLLPRIGVSTGSRGHQIKDIKDSLWSLLLNFSGKHNVIQSRYHRSTLYSRTLFLSNENWPFFTANKWNKVHETVYPINIISYLGIPKATSLQATK